MRIKVAAVLCSMTLLAAPAAQECGPPPAPQWCGVEKVLKDNCQSCHAATPINNAPMPLMTYADTQAPAPTNPFGSKVWEMMQIRVNSSANPMPPGQPLPPDDLAVLNAWFTNGVPGPPAGTVCPP